MNLLSAAIEIGDLPRLKHVDLDALWADLSLRPVNDMVPGLDVFMRRYDEWVEKIRVLGLDGGLLADYRVLPGLDRLLEFIYGRMGWARPEVYVISDLGRKGVDQWSAVSVVSHRNPVILLGSSLVETMTETELAFVVGHETGHLLGCSTQWRREISLSFLIRQLSDGNRNRDCDRMFPGSRWRRIYRQIMENCRVVETRCDRLGLMMCGSVEKAAGALLLNALKNPGLARRVNVAGYLSVHCPLLATAPAAGPITVNAGHPFLPQRIKSLFDFVNSGRYRTLADEFSA